MLVYHFSITPQNVIREILLDFDSEDIKSLYSDITDNLNILIGLGTSSDIDVKFNVCMYLFDKNDTRNGIVLTDELKNFNINSYLEFKRYAESILNNTNINKDIKIVCYGDSLTEGAGGEDSSSDGTKTSYPSVIEKLSGITTINAGIGGDRCPDIFARIGRKPIILNNITIPSTTTPVDLGYPLTTILGNTFKSDILYSALKEGKLNLCIIGGVKGNITQNEYKGNYYFTRLEEGDEININRPTVVTTAPMINRNPNDIYVFYVGQNGVYNDIDDWIKQLRNGIDYIGCDKYLIVVCQTNYHNSTWDETYTKFQKEFGSKFINIHDYLVEYGLQDCGIEEIEAINNGIIPP